MDPFDQIFEDFGGVSKEEWKEKVIADLKGKAFEELLFTDEDGIEHQPYYNSSDLSKSILPITNSDSWKIMHIYDADNWEMKALVEELKYAFDNGLQQAIVKLDHLSKDWIAAVEGLDVHFYCEGGEEHESSICDPIGLALRKGNKIEFNANRKGRFLIDASIYAERGATATQEIAHTLYHLTEYLDLLTEAGVDPKEAIERSWIKITVGNSYFTQIAKIRALRLNIKKLYAHYGVDHEPLIWADSNSYYLDAESFNNNLIRLSCQAMSAVLGNCNLLSLSMQAAESNKKRFAARMCRNVQLILKHESKMDEVDDLVRGSYYIENLTKELTHLSWEKYTQLESKGSLTKLLNDSSFWTEIDTAAKKRLEQYKKGEKVMIGVNSYQHQDGGSAERLRTINESLSDQLKEEA